VIITRGIETKIAEILCKIDGTFASAFLEIVGERNRLLKELAAMKAQQR